MVEKMENLREENERLKKALAFTVKAAEYVFKPNTPLQEGLDPSFYHTLTYEGDLELIRKTIEARQILEESNRNQTCDTVLPE